MSATTLLIPYTGFSGEEIPIRSIYEENGDLLVSLEDIVKVLATENNNLSGIHGKKGLGELVNAASDVLDDDERKFIPVSGSTREELFVTQPGMYRIVSRDSSPACKNFQRWLFHEVLPSIQKYGTYPPPLANKDSELKSLARALVKNSELILREIEEREKLEAFVVEKFGITDEKLKAINQRIDKFSNVNRDNFHDVAVVCAEKSPNVDRDFVFAWCYKLCFEKSINTLTDINDPNKRLFPLFVIEEAIAISLEQTSDKRKN